MDRRNHLAALSVTDRVWRKPILQPVALPRDTIAISAIFIEHAVCTQTALFLPFCKRLGEVGCHRVIMLIQCFADQKIVEIPAALLFSTKCPGEFVSQTRVCGCC